MAFISWADPFDRVKGQRYPMKKPNKLSFFYLSLACFFVLLFWYLLARYGATGGKVIPGPVDTVLGVWAVFSGSALPEHPATGFLGIETRNYLRVLLVLLVSLLLLRLKQRKTLSLLSGQPEDILAPKEAIAKERGFVESVRTATQGEECEVKMDPSGAIENDEAARLFGIDREFSGESITGDKHMDEAAVGFENSADIQPDKISSEYAGPVERALRAYFGSNKNFIKKKM
ncbi:MAG: hypothetical protein ACYS0I_00705 [Planctomycetota bacterium]